jgi:hypothetical protein
MMVYAWFIAIKFDRSLSMDEIETSFYIAVKNGIILDNNLPTDGSKGNWYRCFMHQPIAWMELVAGSIGKHITSREISRGAVKKLGAEYYVIENRSWVKKPGLHFTGETNDAGYNPDPRIEIVGTKTIRGWEILEV